jgi:voltage-gated potassium channel
VRTIPGPKDISGAHPGRAWDFDRFRALMRRLYRGETPRAVRFRLWIIAVDLVLIAFFVVAPMIRETRTLFFVVDYVVAIVLAADLAARSLAYRSVGAFLRRPAVWVDLFILLTLLAPQWLFNLAFLRVLRIWTLFHSEFFWETVGRRYAATRWRDAVQAAATLFTCIFVVTGFVYTIFIGKAAGVNGYVDALYYTVATLTTTGFGDVVLPGAVGKVIAILTMLAGITLFVRLAQALFRPYKVVFPCPSCGLMRHEPDAVHCKACGIVLNIPDEGH